MVGTSDAMQEQEPDAKIRTHVELMILPDRFISWQAESRMKLIQIIRAQGVSGVKSMPAHLPVMATHNQDLSTNLASKGIGLVPREPSLRRYATLFNEARRECEREGWESTIQRRASILLELYSRPEEFDAGLLGGLEIFEGKTYANLRSDPRVSLLFSGEAPRFVSYQVDGEVEFVGPGNAYFEFLLAARELFAKDGFHVLQPDYPRGYLVHVSKVTEKTPFSRGMPHV